MAPNTNASPELPYHLLTQDHYLYDLVYNPMVTPFMQQGIDAKCWVKNGLEMLHGQAEAAWEIWNK
jgi:shikimate dehydrogenase